MIVKLSFKMFKIRKADFSIFKVFMLLILFSVFNFVLINQIFELGPTKVFYEQPCECNELTIHYQENTDFYEPDTKNIQTFDLLDELIVSHSSYKWTHTGWSVNYAANKLNSFKTINVHVVPFSHNDAGWLSTPDSYFEYNSKKILDNVLKQLNKNHKMTFVWSEIWFIKRWYKTLNKDNKYYFKHLLKEGRFEILTGSMIMVDEATSHYTAIIDQLQHGNKWLKDTFNLTVDTAWSLDSFGHSASLAHILQQSGIENLFIQRTHYAFKKHFSQHKSAEFFWKQSLDEKMWNETDKDDDTITNNKPYLFTHMSPSPFYSISYSCGPDYGVCCQFDFNNDRCWKYGKYQRPDMIDEGNVHEKARLLSEQLKGKNSLVRHNNVLFIMGDDFSYHSEYEWDQQFGNMNYLFEYINKHKEEFNLDVKYSTIGKYLKAAKHQLLKRSSSISQIPSLIGDFYPYSDRWDQYWSGLYTTRPHLKRLIRKSFSYLRTAEILLSYGWLQVLNHDKNVTDFDMVETRYMKGNQEIFDKLKDDTSLYNHHDTITGTSKQRVIDSTYDEINHNILKVHKLIALLSTYIFSGQLKQNVPMVYDLDPVVPYQRMFMINILPKKLLFFNSLMHYRSSLITIFLHPSNTNTQVILNNNTNYQVNLKCQLKPIYKNSELIRYKLSFIIDVDAFSTSSVTIKKVTQKDDEDRKCDPTVEKEYKKFKFNKSNDNINADENGEDDNSFLNLTNDFYNLIFCPCSNRLKGLIIREEDFSEKDGILKLDTEFSYYRTGNKYKPLNDKSGAYIFLPLEASKVIDRDGAVMKISTGSIVSSVSIEINQHLKQTFSLINTDKSIGKGIIIDNNIDIRHQDNYELALQVNTNARNVFYTDSNGFQMLRRKYRQKMTIQGNFYPITNLMYVHPGPRHRLNFISNRCHAATNHMGSVEMMLDRRLKQDDWRGLKEGVLDNTLLNTRVIVVPERIKPRSTMQKAELASSLVNEVIFSNENPLIALEEYDTGEINYDHLFHKETNLDAGILPLYSLPKGILLISFKIVNKKSTRINYLITLHNTNNDENIMIKKRKQQFDEIDNTQNDQQVYSHRNSKNTNKSQSVNGFGSHSIGNNASNETTIPDSWDDELILRTVRIPVGFFFPFDLVFNVHETNLIGTKVGVWVHNGLLLIKGGQIKSWIVCVMV